MSLTLKAIEMINGECAGIQSWQLQNSQIVDTLIFGATTCIFEKKTEVNSKMEFTVLDLYLNLKFEAIKMIFASIASENYCLFLHLKLHIFFTKIMKYFTTIESTTAYKTLLYLSFYCSSIT